MKIEAMQEIINNAPEGAVYWSAEMEWGGEGVVFCYYGDDYVVCNDKNMFLCDAIKPYMITIKQLKEELGRKLDQAEAQALDAHSNVPKGRGLFDIPDVSKIMVDGKEYISVNKGALNTTPSWDGTGLPPVGCECIVIPHNTQWGFNYVEEFIGKVIHYHNESFVFCLRSSNAWIEPEQIITSRTDKVDFKVVETPEQKERNQFILNLESMLNSKEMGYCDGLAGAIYDAGYRKVSDDRN